MKPVILHIETSSLACSVALSTGTALVAFKTLSERYMHSAALAPMARDILRIGGFSPGDLDAVSVSIGPGSYTGLRVGLSFAKGLCTILQCPLIAVDTLESLARAAMAAESMPADLYIATLDARRQDAYTGVFDAAGRRLAENSFITVDQRTLSPWTSGGRRVVVCGEGVAKWVDFALEEGVAITEVSCDARNLVSIAVQQFDNQKFADIETCVPAYLKPPNITIPAQ